MFLSKIVLVRTLQLLLLMYLEPDPCKLSPEQGPWSGNIQRYYFNSTSGICLPFIYGGCFANENNFFSKYLCEQQCSGQLILI